MELDHWAKVHQQSLLHYFIEFEFHPPISRPSTSCLKILRPLRNSRRSLVFRPANGHYVAARLAAPPLVGTKFDPFGLDLIHYCDLINTVHLRARLTGQSDIDGVYK